MVQLPDLSVFGKSPSGLSGRPSVDYTGAVAPGRQIVETAGRSGAGLSAFGAGLEKAGTAALAYANDEQQKASRLDGAMANATSTIYEDNIKNAIENEQDPEKIKQLLGGIDAGYQTAGANLTGEDAHLFALKSQHRANQLRLIGENRIRTLNGQSFKVAAEGTLQELQSAYVRGDMQTQHDALDTAGKIYDNMAANGYITSEQAFKYKEAFTKGSVENFIINQPVEKQFELLGVTPQNVNEAAGKGAAFFQSKGWQPHQAAAIMGHLLHESGGKLNPNAVNPRDGADGSDSIGIGQWNSKRAQQLKAFAAANGKPWNDLGIQLAFVQHELETSEAGAASVLRKTGDIDSAAAAFLHYERPKNWQGGLGTAAGGRQRLAYGRRIFSKLGKDGFDASPSAEGSYEVASNGIAGVLSPEDHAKMVNNAFERRHKELAAAAAQEKLQIQQSQDKFSERLVNNNIDNLLDDIKADPVLKQHPEQQRQMMDVAQHHIDALTRNKGGEYGDGFLETMEAIKKGEVTSEKQLYDLAGEKKLSIHGVNELKKVIKAYQSDPDKAVEQKIVSSKLKYAASKFIGPYDLRGKNKEIFNGEFVPLFYRRYSAWVKSGKPSDEFLQKENIDKMVKEIADKNQIAANRVVAGAGTEDKPVAAAPQKDVVLPPPSGVDPEKWGSVVSKRPFARDGKPISALNWSQAVKMLAASPTPDMRKAFSNEFGVSADEILSGIGVK